MTALVTFKISVTFRKSNLEGERVNTDLRDLWTPVWIRENRDVGCQSAGRCQKTGLS